MLVTGGASNNPAIIQVSEKLLTNYRTLMLDLTTAYSKKSDARFWVEIGPCGSSITNVDCWLFMYLASMTSTKPVLSSTVLTKQQHSTLRMTLTDAQWCLRVSCLSTWGVWGSSFGRSLSWSTLHPSARWHLFPFETRHCPRLPTGSKSRPEMQRGEIAHISIQRSIMWI